jgi:hypothetical protein
MEIHAGVRNIYAQFKLQEMLPVIGLRIRCVLYYYMKKYPAFSFLEVVEKTKEDAKGKCN